MKKYGIVITGFMKSLPLSESRCKDEENSKEGAIFASSKNGTFLKCYKCATYWQGCHIMEALRTNYSFTTLNVLTPVVAAIRTI